MDKVALLQLLDRLNLPEQNERYCVIGSAALMLAGLKLSHCEDVDILTSRTGADAFARQWPDAVSETAHAKGAADFRSHYYRFQFPEGAVEVMGQLELRQEGAWQLVTVHETMLAHGVIIPTLAEQQRLLRWFSREKDRQKLVLFS